MPGKFAALNRVAKEVVAQKVEFIQSAKIGKKNKHLYVYVVGEYSRQKKKKVQRCSGGNLSSMFNK